MTDRQDMSLDIATHRRQPLSRLKETITRKWPEALCSLTERRELVFTTGIAELDALFHLGGIPYGQLIEITGGVSSGKTALLFDLLAHWSGRYTITYVDFPDSFFPDAACQAGLDLNHLLLIKPSGQSTGYRRSLDCLKHNIR
ncbi:MAG: DNA recombination/repair protein RecA, partial [candidate division Zixibacteria bacterium]|nr:DNA recombination/repair protein RecA [candidate division Zixibacteria bacterium]